MKKIILALLITIAVGVVWIAYQVTKKSKIAYVRSADLIYNYEGMKEAQAKQEKKTLELKSNLDTLQVNFQKAISQYNQEYPKLTKEEKLKREELLGVQQNQLKSYAQTVEETIKKQDDQLTQGVLNQVNSFVEEYSKKKGYDLVLGTTSSGNILFATESMDITNEVLTALNSQYKQSPPSSN